MAELWVSRELLADPFDELLRFVDVESEVTPTVILSMTQSVLFLCAASSAFVTLAIVGVLVYNSHVPVFLFLTDTGVDAALRKSALRHSSSTERHSAHDACRAVRRWSARPCRCRVSQ